MTDATDRAQSTIIYLTVGALLIIVAVSVAAAIFGGVVGTPNTDAAQDTPTPSPAPTTKVPATQALTATASPTETFTPAVTPIPTTQPTPTPTLTPRLTATPWPTPRTPLTATPSSGPDYSNFTIIIFTLLRDTASEPMRLRGHTFEGEALTFTLNTTAKSKDSHKRMRQFNALATAYAYSVKSYHNDTTGIPVEDIPLRLRVYEVNNTGAPPKTMHINNSAARMWVSGTLTTPEFHKRYWATERNQTAQERDRVREIDQNAGNVTIWPNGTSTRERE